VIDTKRLGFSICIVWLLIMSYYVVFCIICIVQLGVVCLC